MKRFWDERCYKLLSMLMLAIFLPVLLCVLFVGNDMDYWEGMKMSTLLPGWTLTLLALPILCACLYLIVRSGKRHLTKRMNYIVNAVLILAFAAIYFINVRIVREIAFMIPWDIMVVREGAHGVAQRIAMGYQYYYSMYSNNIPIIYILGILYRKAVETGGGVY